jgi:hypothetical protein
MSRDLAADEHTGAMMSWLQGHLWVVGVVVAVGLALGGLAWWTVRRRPATPVPGAAARRRVDLTFAAAVVITLAVGWWTVVWLVEQADQVTDEKDKAAAKADAVRTGAAIALGTGGAAWLLLAYRRQRMEAVDTRERRITELYTKAVEQLGHEKAPVRLGALYSLERLAQNNPEHRQTVIDVFCAYLRMPYSPPAQTGPGTEQTEEAATAGDQEQAPHRVVGYDPDEELQVRQTAQRILAAHLKVPGGVLSAAAAQRRQPSPRQAFWPGISLDLTGAALIEFDLQQASVVQARFVGATFQGDARFVGATFQDSAGFDGATFQDVAGFVRATFQGIAAFDGATFQGDARFIEATFQEGSFMGATFKDVALFIGATFTLGATMSSGAWGARVLHVDNPDLNQRRVWPDGLTVRPDPADPSRGTLVEQAEQPEPAVRPSTRPADSG